MIIQVAREGSPSHWDERLEQLAVSEDLNFRVYGGGGQSWWVAILDGEVAGFAGTQHRDAERLFVGPCGVLPRFRGRGLQRRFLRAREAFARRQGYATLVGAALAENWKSANNFIRCGWEIDRDKAGKDLTYVHFRKELLQVRDLT